MITYKQYFGNEIYEKIIHKPEFLKEVYKIYFNVEKIPISYSQKIKNQLLKDVLNTSLFMAFENKKLIAIAQGSVFKDHFTLNHFFVLKGTNKSLIEQKLITRAIGYLRVKKDIKHFESSYILSPETTNSFKKMFSRENKSKRISYFQDTLFSKKSFKVFKKTSLKRK
ncbi:hypothetical protein GW835_00115 [archaeon]|nr:hypothetical protein [archaeon]NCP78961.1 hypothetical protein [archaeon]NCP97656.1 hypothetical protein [archaeon]NCQ06728.1 hypothetical protein [archaeon]NCQ50524.1 hypothetical protein [archaeon]